ncbi:MAG: hypothetical protein WBA46_14385 [Thermomicrobiales bacterium]
MEPLAPADAGGRETRRRIVSIHGPRTVAAEDVPRRRPVSLARVLTGPLPFAIVCLLIGIGLAGMVP